jgi:hypothetical protein
MKKKKTKDGQPPNQKKSMKAAQQTDLYSPNTDPSP